MDIQQAKDNMNKRVVFRRQYTTIEHGLITSVRGKYVFVRYDTQAPDAAGQATDPDDLTLEDEYYERG